MILEFERPIRELEKRISELRHLAGPSQGLQAEISRLEELFEEAKERVYSNLTPYQRVQVARHPGRPGFCGYRDALFDDFYELSGDRLCGDDQAVCGGFARLKESGRRVVLLGHDKGTELESRIRRNFGMPHPEGYRKVKRLYKLAGRLRLPIVALIDTPGAFAGRGAEERGQAWAISEDLMVLAGVPVPVVAVVTGEGGSGGALAMCLADYVGILENSYLSVIVPEACASIVFRDSARAAEAAEALKLTAWDLKACGIVDEVLPEPRGGAHMESRVVIEAVGEALERALSLFEGAKPETLLQSRHDRYRRILAPTAGENANGHAASTGEEHVSREASGVYPSADQEGEFPRSPVPESSAKRDANRVMGQPSRSMLRAAKLEGPET